MFRYGMVCMCGKCHFSYIFWRQKNNMFERFWQRISVEHAKKKTYDRNFSSRNFIRELPPVKFFIILKDLEWLAEDWREIILAGFTSHFQIVFTYSFKKRNNNIEIYSIRYLKGYHSQCGNLLVYLRIWVDFGGIWVY